MSVYRWTLILVILSGALLCACQGEATQVGHLPETLPESTKGYELYSWQEEGEGWRFTLVTGTNRLKTVEELTSAEDEVSDEGWVKVTVTGEDALLELLERLPAGEQIFWRGASTPLEGEQAGPFRLPGEATVAAVEQRCRELDLEIVVIRDGLEAILAIEETTPAGGPAELIFTLVNHAPYPLYVLRWYTPLEGIAGEIFRVARDGQPLPYQGILATRGDPRPEDYVLLAAGGSETATVDLAEGYDFGEAGTYTITFRSPRISHVARTEAEMAQTVEELGPVTIVSNTVTTNVVRGE